MEIAPFYKIKCLFAGESSVGKSSLVHLIGHDKPIIGSEPTIGIGFASTHIELEEYPLSNPSKLPSYYHQAKEDLEVLTEQDNQIVKLHVWDASGSPRFFSILKTYLRDVDICFLVFDLTDRSSWNQIPLWREEVLKHAKSETNPLFVLVGNKSDKKGHAVTRKEIEERSNEWGIKFYLLSAVQESSSSMLRRMIYMSVQNYHNNMLLLLHENKTVPENITSFKREHFADLMIEGRSGYCCFQ